MQRTNMSFSFRSIRLYTVIVAILFIAATRSQNSSCRQVSELRTCAWIDYNSWFPGLNGDPKSIDTSLGNKVQQIDNDDCRWAFQAYFCASTFPKCNTNQDGPLPVCRDICQDLLDKCDPQYQNGVTSAICDALPETECTSEACSLRPSWTSMTLAGFLILVSIIYSQRRIRLF